jgi:poly(3-hydroxybutyrate) depolymerase
MHASPGLSLSLLLGAAVSVSLVLVGCSASSTTGGSGGSKVSGGTTTATSTAGSGGAVSSGGNTALGGATGSGGQTTPSATGGKLGLGGSVTGGTTSVGGSSASGSGGASASGGTAGTASGGVGAVDAGGGNSGGTSGGIDGGTTMSSGCGKTPKLLKSTPPPSTKINYNKITSASLDRQYILWYPDNYDKNRPYRLIMNYHWYTGSASQVFDCNTEGIKCYTTQTPFFGLKDLADDSTIFVAPDGIDAGWANTNGRDTTLTDDILKAVESDLCIDTTRVFAQGFSYGGAMSATLGCQRADVFRAVVVFAGGISGMSGACTGTSPIAYYGATGTQDSGYSGGQTAVKHFAEVNGCTAQTLPTPPTGGHVCVSFQGCSAGHPVRWCPFDDIHTPSPKDKGATTTWQPKEVWTFLTQF